MEQGTICLPLRREMASDLIAAWTSDLIAEWNAAIESQSAIQSLFLRFSAIQSLSTHFRRLFFSAIMRSHRSQRSNRCFYWFSAIQSLSTHFRRLFCLLIHAFHSGCSLAYHDHRCINWHFSWIAGNLKNSNARKRLVGIP